MNTSTVQPGFQTIPRDRQIVLDVIRWARSVPSFAVECTVELTELAALRAQCNQRPPSLEHNDTRFNDRRLSWSAIFLRAFGLAINDCPLLRQSYHSFPRQRLYQTNDIAISLTVSRQVEGQQKLYFGKMVSPNLKSVSEIQQTLNYYQFHDAQEAFGQQCRAASLPRVFRDWLWWWRLHGNPAKRAKRLGNAGFSTLAGQGMLNRNHPCFLTSSLSYGPVDQDGKSIVTLQCDHRVLDGVQASEALQCMTGHLKTTVTAELRNLLAQWQPQQRCSA